MGLVHETKSHSVYPPLVTLFLIVVHHKAGIHYATFVHATMLHEQNVVWGLSYKCNMLHLNIFKEEDVQA